MKFFGIWVAAFLACGPARAAECDTALAGPYAAGQVTVSIPGTQGANLNTDVYYPGTAVSTMDTNAGICPAIVLGHGFSGSKSQHANTGRHLATRGYIVLIPNFNGGSDHARNGADLRRCLDWIAAQNADGGSIFFGRVALDRLGASGYSAGGLSAILAAAQDPRIRALSLLDPVDNGGQGLPALPGITVPVAITFSEPSSCNANGSATTLFAGVQGLKRGMKIVGANHTDPQDPPSLLVAVLCGAANSTRQMLYRRYLTSWFDFFLREDQACISTVFNYPAGLLRADLDAGKVTYSAPTAPLMLSAKTAGSEVAIAVTGPAGQRFILERSAMENGWSPVMTNQVAEGPLSLTNATEDPSSFFRTRSVP